MANNYGSLEGTMDANGILGGEIQFNGAGGKVKDVQVNDVSVVDANGIAKIDLTDYAKTEDIPTDLADLQDDADHRTVTDAEKTEWSGKSNVSANPSTTTETLTGIEIDGTAYAIPSGDVKDVKVDGTSVVDPVTKEANIDLTGYAEKMDIHNPTITIQKNGQNVDTFTLNQTANKVIDISVPTKTSDLQNDDSFITNTVNNLANYYLKSDTYTQTEVNNLISAAVNGRFEKVTTLPASGEPNVIYLVPKTTALTNNVYDEYIWQDNAWELLGSTEIDLSNYVTTTDLSTALADYVTSSTFNTTIANYYTKTEIGNLLDDKVDKVSGKGLSTYDYDATAKGIVDNVTTNLAGKVDKVNGKGLSTEDYTTTEKNKLAGISTNANKVEASTTNGNIKIDDTETQVYDDSDIQGKIDETTTSISGNPISISGLKANQLAVNPIITFEPIQDLHGQSKPYPAGGGKNLLPLTIDNIKDWNTAGTWTGNAYVYNGVTYTILTDDANNVIGIKVNGTASANSGLRISGNASTFLTDGVSYKMKGCPSESTTSTYYFVLATTFDSGRSVYEYGSGATFTYTASSYANKQFYIGIWAGYNASNLMYYPMVSVSTGSTYPDFEPYSNICPISGYDKIEVLSCGKNLFDKSKITLNTRVNASGTTAYQGCDCSDFIPVKPNTAYYFTNVQPSTTMHAVYFYNKAKEYLRSTALNTLGTASVSTADGEYYVRLNIPDTNLNTAQMEEGTSATTYSPYVKTTSISESLGQTVYYSHYNLRTGDLPNEGDAVDLGDLSWTYWSGGAIFYATLSNYKKESGCKALCEGYNYVGTVGGANLTVNNTCALLVDSSANYRIYVKDTRYTDAATFKTAVAGIKFAYEKATPTPIQLAPREISLLKDYAYLSTNGTSIALDYHNGELASLGDVVQLNETLERKVLRTEGHAYSTSEQVVGTWIDGKPLYEKTKEVLFSNLTHEGNCYYTSITSSGETLKYVIGAIANSQSYGNTQLGCTNYASNSNYNNYWELGMYYENICLTFHGTTTATNVNPSGIIITYQYTKTTD